MDHGMRKRPDLPPSYPEVSYLEVPPSLTASSTLSEPHGSPNKAGHRASTAPSLTPYLNLPSRLSQIWINRWTVLLLLVLVRLMLLMAQLNDNVGDAKSNALSACSKVEDVGSSMASMPHYLSVGVNKLAAGGIEKSIEALLTGLDLVLRGVEAIIIFYINFLTATYVCLITALVHGSLDMVASATKDASKAFNKAMDGVSHEIEDIAGGLQNAINKVTDGIQNTVFGSFVPDIPKIDFSKPLDELKKFDLNPDDFVQDVRKLKKELPDFEQVQNLTKEAISIPFDFARKGLNESLGGYRFDRTVFPLAQKQRLTFCSDNDSLQSFFGKLLGLLHNARVVFIVLLSLLAIAVMAPIAWFEIRRWRRQQKHARLIAQNRYDAIDTIYIASRPITATCGIKLASRFKGRHQIIMRWFVAYATSLPALFVLSIALAGFVSCFCQFILLSVVQKEVPALATEVGEFAGNVVTTLEKVSDEWAAGANHVVQGLNDDINNDVLVYVTNATDAVNTTLNVFLDAMETGLETVFNDTILLKPIQAVMHCVIGIKIESVQKGLTWVHDHAHVNLPLFDTNVFSLGANESIKGDSDLHTFLASPATVTTDEVTGAVDRVIEWLHKSLVQEALISTGVLLVYLIVVLIGLTRTLAFMATHRQGGADDAAYGDSRYPGSSSLYQGSKEGGHIEMYGGPKR